MYQNQRGEIATILALITFVVIGAATVVSTLVNTSTERRTSNTQASEACWVTKGDQKGKACDIPECNATLGGNPGNCAACNGGWCEGGFCRTCGNKPPDKALPTAVNNPTKAPDKTSCQPGTKKGEYCDEFTNPNSSFIVETWYTSDCKDEFKVTTRPCGKSANGGGNTQPPQTASTNTPVPQQEPQQPQEPPTGGGEQPPSGGEQPPSQPEPPSGGGSSGQQDPPDTPVPPQEATCAVYVSVFEGDKRISGITVTVKRGFKEFTATTDTGGYIRTSNSFTKGEIEIKASGGDYNAVTKTDTIDPAASCSTAVTLTKKGSSAPAVVCTGEYNKTFPEAQVMCTSNGYTQNPTQTQCYKCNAAQGGTQPPPASLTCNNCKISCGSNEQVDSSKVCIQAGQVCCGPRQEQGPPSAGGGSGASATAKCFTAYCDSVSKQISYSFSCPNNASCEEDKANKWFKTEAACKGGTESMSYGERTSWCNQQPRKLRFEASVDASGVKEFSQYYHRDKGKPVVFEIRTKNHKTIAKFEMTLDEFLARGKKLSAFSEVYANKAGDLAPDFFGNEQTFYAILKYGVPSSKAGEPYTLKALPSGNIPMNWSTSKLTIEYTVN